MDSSQKSIFNFTEITSIDSEKKNSLPFLNLTKTPKTAASLKLSKGLALSKNQSSWTSLTQRNLTATQKASPGRIDSLLIKINHNMDLFSSTTATHIKSWDLDSNLKNQVGSMQKIIEKKQKIFNKIRNEAEKKESLLEKLKYELSNLNREYSNEPKLILSKRLMEYGEINKALMNEKSYNETLNYMLGNMKIIVMRADPPVIKIKDNLMGKNREITELENFTERALKEHCEAKKVISGLEFEINQIEAKQAKFYSNNLSLLMQKRTFESILTREKEVNNKVKEYEKIQKKIQILQPIQADLEEEEAIITENAEKQDRQQYYENKHLRLRQVVSTSKIDEIFANYETLKEHSLFLQIAVSQSLHKIDTLTHERNKLTTNLNEIFLNHEDDRRINYREFEKIELSLKEKNKSMDENEKILNDLTNMIGAVCGSVSRIYIQLHGSIKVLDIKPSTVAERFEECVRKIYEKCNRMVSIQLDSDLEEEMHEKFPKIWQIRNY